MDEIGRGTSTYDGLSLAWACADHLCTVNRAYTLFATHYFELTQLAETHTEIANVHLDAVEHRGEIVFMHSVKTGPANRSYGLQVAQLAGLPLPTINRARQLLQQLEEPANTDRPELSAPGQLPLFEDQHSTRLIANLKFVDAINPDQTTPRQALDLLYKIKAAVKNSEQN